MKKIHALTAAIVAIAMTGCATTGGSPFATGPSTPSSATTVSTDQKADARRGAIRAGAKGCGMGAAVGALGALFGGGVNVRAIAAGCATGGLTTGIQAYQQQLADFRALQGKVTVGAVVKVREEEKVVEGRSTKTASGMTLDLDAAKVSAKHADIQAVISELAKTLNRQTMPITVGVVGTTTDRAWLVGQLKAQLNNAQVTVTEAAGAAPVLLVSPMPQVK